MSLIAYLIALVVTGLVVGALARLLLPGRDPMSIVQTILVGMAGSFAAGLLAMAIFDGRPRGGLLLSVLFATLLVWLIRRSRERHGHGGGLRHGHHGRRGPLGTRF
jgi:uncharacterized membrane protein YeaQ/YmgE (transglycosylase-associated protein family)